MSNFVHLSKAFNSLNFTVIKSWSFQLILHQCGRTVTLSDGEVIQVQRITNIFWHPGLWDRQEVPARPSLISCSRGLAQSSRGFELPCFSFHLWLNGHPVPLSLTVTNQHINTLCQSTTDQQFPDVFKSATLKCKSCHFADLKCFFLDFRSVSKQICPFCLSFRGFLDSSTDLLHTGRIPARLLHHRHDGLFKTEGWLKCSKRMKLTDETH